MIVLSLAEYKKIVQVIDQKHMTDVMEDLIHQSLEYDRIIAKTHGKHQTLEMSI